MRDDVYAILDEPTASLDEATSLELVRNAIDRFRGSGIAIITHSAAVADLCDRKIRVGNRAVVDEGRSLVEAA